MKKFIYSFMLAVVGMTTALFTSCTNEESINFPIEEELAGNYKGKLEVTVDGQNLGEQSQKITVEKASEKSINLSLKNFSFIGINLGDIELNDCPLSENSGNYAFTGTTLLDTEVLKADVKATGTIGGGKVEISMDIDADLSGVKQSVKVVYTGEKLKGTESSEAKITKFIFDRNVAAVDSLVISQPVIDEESKTITFMVADTAKAEHLAALVPTIEVSEKATVTPGSGVAQNFSNGKSVEYTVVAEDGTTVVYTVKAPQKGMIYSFEEWEEPTAFNKNYTLLPKDIWSSSAAGAGILGGILLEKEDAGKEGLAAKMITFEYAEEGNQLIPKITSGSIFIGKFDMMPALPPTLDRLSCTQFGLPTRQLGIIGKPVTFKGFYKYVSGDKYIDGAEDPAGAHPIEGKKDECAIQAVLYEAKDAAGNDVTLTGHDINTSEYIVAMASLSDGTEKSEFTSFEIPFEYRKTYDASKEYKFTIVCSSSKDGDTFKGSGGSVLTVDEFEVICE